MSLDTILVAWGFLTAVVAFSVVLFVAVRTMRGQVNARWFLRRSSWAVLLLGCAAVWANPFVGARLSSMHLEALERRAMSHAGRSAASVIASCGTPASQSATELVYDSPWFACYPLQLRILLANGVVCASYVDD